MTRRSFLQSFSIHESFEPNFDFLSSHKAPQVQQIFTAAAIEALRTSILKRKFEDALCLISVLLNVQNPPFHLIFKAGLLCLKNEKKLLFLQKLMDLNHKNDLKLKITLEYSMLLLKNNKKEAFDFLYSLCFSEPFKSSVLHQGLLGCLGLDYALDQKNLHFLDKEVIKTSSNAFKTCLASSTQYLRSYLELLYNFDSIDSVKTALELFDLNDQVNILRNFYGLETKVDPVRYFQYACFDVQKWNMFANYCQQNTVEVDVEFFALHFFNHEVQNPYVLFFKSVVAFNLVPKQYHEWKKQIWKNREFPKSLLCTLDDFGIEIFEIYPIF